MLTYDWTKNGGQVNRNATVSAGLKTSARFRADEALRTMPESDDCDGLKIQLRHASSSRSYGRTRRQGFGGLFAKLSAGGRAVTTAILLQCPFGRPRQHQRKP